MDCNYVHEVKPLPELSKEEFINLLKASESRNNKEFGMLYDHLLYCFTRADRDFDGLITRDEFVGLIEYTAHLPRAHGLVPTKEALYGDDDQKMNQVRTEHFNSMDHNKDGTITFNEFLSYTTSHIYEKLKQVA